MQKNILITGIPKSGKSTLLKKLIKDIPNKVGFVTSEMLGENGRVGFKIETYSGHEAVLAHVDFKTTQQVSRYFVDAQGLESLIPEVSHFNKENILYLDEIGQMQLFSQKFKELVGAYLDSQNTLIATLSQVYQDGFTDEIRKRDDVILIELTPESREKKELFVRKLLQKIEKARTYLKEPDRFAFEDRSKKVILRSEHGTRTLVLLNAQWSCTCDFFKENSICSHVIATAELAKSKLNR